MKEVTVKIEKFRDSLIIEASCPTCGLRNIGVSANHGMIRSGQEIRMRHKCDHWHGWGSGSKEVWFFFGSD